MILLINQLNTLSLTGNHEYHTRSKDTINALIIIEHSRYLEILVSCWYLQIKLYYLCFHSYVNHSYVFL